MIWDPWLTNSVSTVCLLLPLKCLIVKDRVRPCWVVAFISLHGSLLLLPRLLPLNPSAPPHPHFPLVTCGSVLIHSAGHMGNFFGSLSFARRPSWKPSGRPRSVARSVSGNERRPSTQKRSGGQSEHEPRCQGVGGASWPAPTPLPVAVGMAACKKQGGKLNEDTAIIQTMNAHECLRMLFLSSPSSAPSSPISPSTHSLTPPLSNPTDDACVLETTPALP